MGNVAAFSVRQWQFTLVLFAMLAAMGVSSLLSIPRAEDPSFPIPTILVVAVLPGADTIDLEKQVTDPLEDAIDSLDDINKITSRTRDGVAVITVEFDWSSDAERKYDQVVREVNAIRPTLPAGLVRLEVKKFNTALTNFMQVALVGDGVSALELRKRADDLRDIIDRVPGVWESEIWGEERTEVRVAVDAGRLAELRLPVTAVADALKAEGAAVPLGALHAGERRFTVKTEGDFDTLDDIANTVVRAADGRVVRVHDVADVTWAADEANHIARFNGKRAVFVTANQKPGQNIFELKKNAYAALDEFERSLPSTIKLERGFDQSENVAKRLSALFRDFAIALGLVLITLIPLGFRASLVVMLAIPLSLAIGVTVLQFAGFTLNQLSIAGFVLSLGLLVDDSIVVTENIARHLRMGKSREEAAIEGTRQIAVAVLGCTATLLLAFLPLMFLPEGSGKFIKSLPVSVLATVAASLFVALTMIPFLAARILSRHEDPEGNKALQWVMGAIHAVYRPILHRALERPGITVLIATLLFAGSIALVPRIGFSLFPSADIPQFLIEIDLPDGAPLAETDKAVAFVEEQVKRMPDVRFVMANAGHGNPRIYYNITPREDDPTHGAIFVGLTEWKGRQSTAELDKLRARLAAYPGAQIIVRVFENGPPIEAPIAVRILGPELPVLKELAAKVTSIIEGTPGSRDVVNPLRLDRTDLDLGIDLDKAGVLGVPAGAVDRAVRLSLSGEAVATYRESDGDDYPVTLRLPMEGRHELSVLGDIRVPGAAGAVPLSAISDPHFITSPARIDRFNRERAVTITAFTATGHNTDRVTRAIGDQLSALGLPPGYRLMTGGEAETRSKSFAGLSGAILVAMFGIMAVLILEFRSFATTAVVAGVIPLGIIGGMVALFVTGYTLSFTAVIGFIALIGIEIKNSILLVDFTTQLRRAGTPLKAAIEEAGEVRFLPVLLTSVTAIGGLMPLALGGSGLYSPLAAVIIGGLVSSTVLSRLVTPAMYLLLAPKEVD
ncbi:efflux RND transporter permease subunit [Niveispirillum cyanobacteriorum]|uniref:Multidrug transporter AcrB n=1 Tax=Niveispirillum cyanobacteriorum TaxID=1612173 RepID=A0A2K9NL86_9PROT|nr:efflux RND transporter permease subunit [Niveispirillum cyanobacteriorum]AUN33396.1 multidrug transporter AcrB [Niveispirillum cyanobacteriorum]GGE48995.1 multidrug transporter AcrB [Niveispirillum cyanobacteriorum]